MRYEVEIGVADSGETTVRTHTYIIRAPGRIYAEIKALRKASWRFRGAAVQVLRVTLR